MTRLDSLTDAKLPSIFCGDGRRNRSVSPQQARLHETQAAIADDVAALSFSEQIHRFSQAKVRPRGLAGIFANGW